MNHATLSPCKHCGSEYVYPVRTITDNIPCWHVECTECGMRTADYPESLETETTFTNTFDDIVEVMESAVDSAVDAWNMRPEDNDDEAPCEGPVHTKEGALSFVDDAMDMLNALCDMAHQWAEAFNTKGAK